VASAGGITRVFGKTVSVVRKGAGLSTAYSGVEREKMKQPTMEKMSRNFFIFYPGSIFFQLSLHFYLVVSQL
jgi:hypothetical protein